jgi:mannose-6-phosphate isomerase-like protein (cupin superfamily)
LGIRVTEHSDCPVQDFFTYGQWLEHYHNYPVIKVEGIEQLALVREQFKRVNPKSIHLFVNQKFGYSFNWHRDNVNVLLYVLSGKKTLHLENRVFDIFPGQYAVIPRGQSHRVSSTANTWALSVGY